MEVDGRSPSPLLHRRGGGGGIDAVVVVAVDGAKAVSDVMGGIERAKPIFVVLHLVRLAREGGREVVGGGVIGQGSELRGGGGRGEVGVGGEGRGTRGTRTRTAEGERLTHRREGREGAAD